MPFHFTFLFLMFLFICVFQSLQVSFHVFLHCFLCFAFHLFVCVVFSHIFLSQDELTRSDCVSVLSCATGTQYTLKIQV